MNGAIPELEKTDFNSIRQWFARVIDALGGEGWHADDDPSDIINISTGKRIFTDSEAEIVGRAMTKVFKAANEWPDPGLVYHLAMMGSFEVEKLYPGFVLDMALAAGRLGHVTIPDRNLPNLLVEDMGQYAIIEFSQEVGPVSEQNRFILRAVEMPNPGPTIDPSKLVVREDDALEFDDIGDLDDKIIELANQSPAPRG